MIHVRAFAQNALFTVHCPTMTVLVEVVDVDFICGRDLSGVLARVPPLRRRRALLIRGAPGAEPARRL